MSHHDVKEGITLSHQWKALEAEMVGEERWAEIRRQHDEEGHSQSKLLSLSFISFRLIV